MSSAVALASMPSCSRLWGACVGVGEPGRSACRQGGALASQHRFATGATANFLKILVDFESASCRPPILHRDRGNSGLFAPVFSRVFLAFAWRSFLHQDFSEIKGHRSREHGRDDADEHSPPRGPTFQRKALRRLGGSGRSPSERDREPYEVDAIAALRCSLLASAIP